jgi:hypothetical protein
MALTEDEKATLAALQAKENEPDDDDNEPVEVWDKDGNGARLSHKHGKKWLIDHGFIPDDTPPPNNDDDDDDKTPKGKQSTGKGRQSASKAKPRTSQRYFGR